MSFSEQVEAVCDTYLEAPALAKDHRTHTVSTDEMTGIQALERNAPESADDLRAVPDGSSSSTRGMGR